MNKEINIISFDNPYPPNYGGIIEVFFKIKAFHTIGYKINLHCYTNTIPKQYNELSSLCKEIYFYKTKKKPKHLFSSIPYSVVSRYDSKIAENLNKNQAPILFEGLQTTYLLQKHNFANRKCFLRLLNIEEFYYLGLAKNESSIFKKIAFYFEAKKYVNYKAVFSKFDKIFTLSNYEKDVVKSQFENTFYVPVFHGNTNVTELDKKGNFALFHGDLTIADNKKSLKFIVSVFKTTPNLKLVIASGSNEKYVSKLIADFKNIKFIKINNFKELKELLSKAHITVNWSFQKSGTKLKCLNSLFNSRFCIINENIIDDKIITQLCFVAKNFDELKETISSLFNKDFEDYLTRKEILENYMSDINNIKKLTDLMN